MYEDMEAEALRRERLVIQIKLALIDEELERRESTVLDPYNGAPSIDEYRRQQEAMGRVKL